MDKVFEETVFYFRFVFVSVKSGEKQQQKECPKFNLKGTKKRTRISVKNSSLRQSYLRNVALKKIKLVLN